MELFANPWAGTIFCLLTLVMAIFTLMALAQNDTPRTVAIAPAVLLLVCGFMWNYSATHRIVPPQQQWVVINTADGSLVGNTRTPGLTTKPHAMWDALSFPYIAEQRVCMEFTPATKDTYEVLLRICGVYNAKTLKWAEQYKLRGFRSEADVVAFWVVQTKELVRGVMQNTDINRLTSSPNEVANDLRLALMPWFEKEQIEISQIVLETWNPTSVEVAAALDKAASSSAQVSAEKQLMQVAEAQRKRLQFEAETSGLLMTTRGAYYNELFSSLNITDDAAKASVISTMSWSEYANSHPGTQVIVGGVSAVAK